MDASSTHASSSSASSTRPSPSTSAAVMAPAPVQVKAPSTEPFLKDFTLLAEAAKRAQVAVMVRDFEDCGI
ncbi:thiol methyltransferase [Trichoderma arundinaceum]|uniref:Thiol methyltransferase n=1 Tax=Trichoderma arundinaceum TaxID=490622 RepID=A0A395N9W5_TRIAR|nr:thiol methyltransferase [Trichoderma arundinaceum]